MDPDGAVTDPRSITTASTIPVVTFL